MHHCHTDQEFRHQREWTALTRVRKPATGVEEVRRDLVLPLQFHLRGHGGRGQRVRRQLYVIRGHKGHGLSRLGSREDARVTRQGDHHKGPDPLGIGRAEPGLRVEEQQKLGHVQLHEEQLARRRG